MISKTEIKKIRSLDSKKGRDIHNLILLEGKRLIEQAIKSDFNIDKIWISEGFNNKNEEFIKQLNGLAIDSISNQDLKKAFNSFETLYMQYESKMHEKGEI